MLYCQKCNKENAYKRLDLKGELILCDSCYGITLFDIDCAHCENGYYDDSDKLRCNIHVCNPTYNI